MIIGIGITLIAVGLFVTYSLCKAAAMEIKYEESEKNE